MREPCLSFELSVREQRVLVNSGTSLYGIGAERLRQRQTAAHNTVSIGTYDSSQVWSGFRVAKRAYAKLEQVYSGEDQVQIIASHDGYLKQSPKVKHTRELLCKTGTVTIKDVLTKAIPASFHLHLHPCINIIAISSNQIMLKRGDKQLCFISSSEDMEIKDSTWHPEFGSTIPNNKIEINFVDGTLTTEIKLIRDDS